MFYTTPNYKMYGRPAYEYLLRRDGSFAVDVRDISDEGIARNAKKLGMSPETLMYTLWPNWVPPSKPFTCEERRALLRPWPEGMREATRLALAEAPKTWKMPQEETMDDAATLKAVTAMFE